MPIQQALGNAAADGFGGGVAAVPNYIEDVFSTFLYTGNGSTQTITNGIDLSTKGGLVWIKSRAGFAADHVLTDTTRGYNRQLYSDSMQAADTYTNCITSFSTSGFAIGSNANTNYLATPTTYASWTFRKQPKFFDIVTYTGDGVSGRTVPHNLTVAPGFVIVKRTDASSNWACRERIATGYNLLLNTTDVGNAAATIDNGFIGACTSTTIALTTGSVNADNVNASGGTYVAYLFAHNAGGFGLTGTDNVISCGSFTQVSGSVDVNLGYEPQWLLYKDIGSGGYDWQIIDNMRGFTTSTADKLLQPNTSAAESSNNIVGPTATGFHFDLRAGTYIYIAIRRGPMKVPTDATKVFSPDYATGTSTSGTVINAGFAPDSYISKNASGSGFKWTWFDRLMGNFYLSSNNTDAQIAASDASFTASNVGVSLSTWAYVNSSSYTYSRLSLKRAPNFYDVVYYTGNGINGTTQSHNLGVTPEMWIVKKRSAADNWAVGTTARGSNVVELDSDGAEYDAGTGTAYFSNGSVYTAPTSSVIWLGSNARVNASGSTYVARLFASCPGVSKVGSYTGTGSTLNIDCGFAGGARMVLIKRTNGTGDWYLWTTAMGIVSGNDPFLLLNLDDAVNTSNDFIAPYSAGFSLPNSGYVNFAGGTFIFLAIA